MARHLGLSGVSFHDVAHSVQSSHIVNEVTVVLDHLYLVVVDMAFDFLLVEVLLFALRGIGVNEVASIKVEHFRFYHGLGELGPNVSFEEFVAQSRHGALHDRGDDCIVSGENVIVVV